MSIPNKFTTFDQASYYERQHGQGALHFKFAGTTLDYYGLYLSNTFLTVITFGIYSAWAKVRNKRFFYGNTYLDGHNFDFDANPVAILISRVIVLAIVLAFFYGEDLLGWVFSGVGVLSLILFCLFPIAVVRGRAFNARHTTHRSVRFSYDRVYRPSLYLFVAYLAPAIVLSGFASALGIENPFQNIFYAIGTAYLVLFTPAYFYFKHRIQVNQLNFGTLGFAYKAKLDNYYIIALVALLLGAATVSIALIFGFLVMELFSKSMGVNIIVLSTLISGLVFFGSFRSGTVALFYSSIEFDEGSKVISGISAKTYFFKYFLVNSIALVFSLGLLLPWVRVRTWRYVTEQMSFLPSRQTGVVLAGPDKDITPIAGEFADVSDFDFDFGVI